MSRLASVEREQYRGAEFHSFASLLQATTAQQMNRGVPPCGLTRGFLGGCRPRSRVGFGSQSIKAGSRDRQQAAGVGKDLQCLSIQQALLISPHSRTGVLLADRQIISSMKPRMPTATVSDSSGSTHGVVIRVRVAKGSRECPCADLLDHTIMWNAQWNALSFPAPPAHLHLFTMLHAIRLFTPPPPSRH